MLVMVMMVVFRSWFLQVAAGAFSRDSYGRRRTTIPIPTAIVAMTRDNTDAGGKDVDAETIITILGFCNECIGGRLWTHEFIRNILIVVICIMVMTLIIIIGWEEDFTTVFPGWGPCIAFVIVIGVDDGGS